MWAKLVELGKAFGADEFGAKALAHNLSKSDYGRPLNELRDLWWSSPRLPLLPAGDADLQRAIFEAIKNGNLRVIGDHGTERAVTRPRDIGVGSAALRLSEVGAAVTTEKGETPEGGRSGEARPRALRDDLVAAPKPMRTGPIKEAQVSFSLTSGLRKEDRRQAIWQLLYALAERVDEGASPSQVVVKVVIPEDAAEKFNRLATEAGVNISITAIS